MKTIEEIVDENPDRSPEEHGEMFAAQSDGPENSVASNTAGRMDLNATPDENIPKFSLETGNVPSFSMLNPPKGVGVEKLPPSNAASMMQERANGTISGQSATELELDRAQPDEGMVVNGEQSLTEAQKYTKDSKSAQSRVKDLFTTREADSERIRGDIEGQEDAIRETRNDSRTESALAAGGKVLAGTLGNMLGYDAKPQVQGFEDAQKSIAARPDELKQRREFLKERLYRTDDNTKAESQKLAMQGAARKETTDASAEADEFNERVTGARNKTAANQITANKLTLEKDLYDSESPVTDNDKSRYKLRLQMLAKKPGPNKEVAQAELDNWGKVGDDGKVLGTDLLPPPQMRERLEGILKADKNGQKWSLENYRRGNVEGSMLVEETTGEYKDLGSGVKTPGVGSGNANKEEDMTLKLSDRVAKANLPALKDSLDRINETVRKNGGKVKNIDGTDTLSRMTPNSLRTFLASKEGREFGQNLSNMSNQVLKAAAGSAVTVSESERVMIEELGQGKITDPDQIQTGINMINSLYDRINSNIKGGFTAKTKTNYINQGGLDINSKATESTEPKKSWRDLVPGGK